jgi:RHS repeat-associated protein
VHADHLGTPQYVTNPSQVVEWRDVYQPFGLDSPTSLGNVNQSLRFPGMYFDSETGLYYNNQRYYDRTTGRYIQSDPVGLDAGTTNVYAYVGDDPFKWVDPSGLSDINLFPRAQKQWGSAQLYDPPEVFSVAGHGNPQTMYDPNGNPLTPQDIANRVEANPNYMIGEPVSLLSCSTGQGVNSFAQQLANILGAPVTAPDNLVWLTTNGVTVLGLPVTQYESDVIGPTQDTPIGHRITFLPQH